MRKAQYIGPRRARSTSTDVSLLLVIALSIYSKVPESKISENSYYIKSLECSVFGVRWNC